MTLTDTDVGITEFLGEHVSFCAVVKQQLSDFVVNEVSREGEVIRLTSTAVVDQKSAQASNAVAESNEGAAEQLKRPVAKPLETESQWDEACQLLQSKLSPSAPGTNATGITASAAIRNYVTANEDILVLPPLSDKKDRTAIHEWVKEYLPDFITDTVEVDDGKRAIRVRKRDACRPWKRRKTDGGRDGSASGNPDAALDNTYDPREHAGGHCGRSRGRGGAKRQTANAFSQFVLWKQDKDTTGALTEIARRLRISVDALSHAGTKDKRAITTQRIRVRGIPPHRLAGLNNSFLNLRGSQRMVIGDFKVLSGAENRQLSLGDLSGNRFTLVLRGLDIHDETGEKNVLDAVASVRERGFINYFGLQRFGSGAASTHETGYAVLRGDFEEACRLVLLPAVIPGVEEGERELREERRRSNAALNGFAAGTITARQLFHDLPHWMNLERSLAMAYMRGEERGATTRDHRLAFASLPRNMRKMYGHAVQSYLWNLMASSRIRHSRTPFAIEGDLVPKSGKRVSNLSSRTEVRPVTAAEAAECSVALNLVLIPVPGSQVAVPNTETGSGARAVLAKEKVDMQLAPVDYDMAGTYRWLIACPTDIAARIACYSDPQERLVPSDVAESVIGKDRNGTKSILNGKREDCNVVESKEHENVAMRALIVSFTLGCAEYATMLMRELTKQESSVANQKAQQAQAFSRSAGLASTSGA